MPTQPPPEVAAFALAAARFCGAMETPSPSPEDNLRELQVLLAELHVAALRLPDLFSAEDEPDLEVDVRKIAEGRLRLPADFYWDAFEPLANEPDSLVGNSLVDDVGDIYRDVKLGLLYWDRGLKVSACWHWRFLFHVHWGEHLTGAMRAFYWTVRTIGW